jgi:hypothetical protein
MEWAFDGPNGPERIKPEGNIQINNSLVLKQLKLDDVRHLPDATVHCRTGLGQRCTSDNVATVSPTRTRHICCLPSTGISSSKA